MFQGIAFGALGVDLSQVCDANGQNCTYVNTPTGPGPVMPAGPQPAGTTLHCDYASDADPGTCYYAVDAGTIANVDIKAGVGGGLSAAALKAAADAKAKNAATPGSMMPFLLAAGAAFVLLALYEHTGDAKRA